LNQQKTRHIRDGSLNEWEEQTTHKSPIDPLKDFVKVTTSIASINRITHRHKSLDQEEGERSKILQRLI
jgi:hypothetical protein